jgi:hypothetical protein
MKYFKKVSEEVYICRMIAQPTEEQTRYYTILAISRNSNDTLFSVYSNYAYGDYHYAGQYSYDQLENHETLNIINMCYLEEYIEELLLKESV